MYLSVVSTTCSWKTSVYRLSHALISRRCPLPTAHTTYNRGRCEPSHVLECSGLNYGIYYPSRCLSCSLLLWYEPIEKIQSRISNQGPQIIFRLKIGTMLHYMYSLFFSRSMIEIICKGSKLAFVGGRGGTLYLIFPNLRNLHLSGGAVSDWSFFF